MSQITTITQEQKKRISLTLKPENDEEKKITVDLPVGAEKTNELVLKRIGANPVKPELVDPESIKDRSVYKRFNDTEKKEVFRQNLLNTLAQTWKSEFGDIKAAQMVVRFMNFAQNLDEKGAVVLGAILSTENFQKLIDEYTKILDDSGSKSWIHTFANLANHPEFLTNKNFNAAFLHPLLIALVSYRVGGPIRMVDARGKDA